MIEDVEISLTLAGFHRPRLLQQIIRHDAALRRAEAVEEQFKVLAEACVESTSAPGAPSSRRRVDGVEVDAAIQDERAVEL